MREIDLRVKWYLNGFPKSGLHLAEQMVSALASKLPSEPLRPKPWAGTFGQSSWTEDWANLKRQLYYIASLQPGFYLKGHCGWKGDIEAFLYLLGVAHVFIYRDPRDVAVSQTYHILNEDEAMWLHPGRDRYKALGGKHEVLKAVITGLDEYAGVMARWEHYAPWLGVDWVFKLRFEEAIADPHGVAKRLAQYGLDRLGQIFELQFINAELDAVADQMVEVASHKEESPTFRTGRVGDWRIEFDDEHRQLFKRMDRNDWLVKLGYENGPDW